MKNYLQEETHISTQTKKHKDMDKNTNKWTNNYN